MQQQQQPSIGGTAAPSMTVTHSMAQHSAPRGHSLTGLTVGVEEDHIGGASVADRDAFTGQLTRLAGLVPGLHQRPGRTAQLQEQCRGLLQEIRNELVVDTKWHLPFPSVPAAQLLYVPEAVRDVFACPTRDIMHSDIDALQIGLLDRLNVLLPPTDAFEMLRVRNAVADAEADYHEQVRERRNLGLAVDPLPALPERYLNLDAEDVELVAEDLGVKPLDEEDVPSATLLKNPIYTELGRMPLEARQQARIDAAFARMAGAAAGGGGGSNGADAAAAADSRMAVALSRRNTQGRGDADGEAGGQQQQLRLGASKDERWVQQINLSFRNAKALDNIFALFSDKVAASLLGAKVVAGAAAPSSSVRDAQEGLRDFTKFYLDIIAGAQELCPVFVKDVTRRLREAVAGRSSVEEVSMMIHEKWTTDAAFVVEDEAVAASNSNEGDEDEDDDPFAAASTSSNNKRRKTQTAAQQAPPLLPHVVESLRRDFLPKIRTLLAEWRDLSDNFPGIIVAVDEKAHAAGASADGGLLPPMLNLNSGARHDRIDIHLQALLKDANPALQQQQQQQQKRSGAVIALQHPERPTDVPVSVLPIHTLDPYFDSDLPNEAGELAARVFVGVPQHEEARPQQVRRHLPTVVFSSVADEDITSAGAKHGGVVVDMVLRPDARTLAAQEQQNGGAGVDANEPAIYVPETTAFELFRQDDKADGLFLLKLGRDGARFARVPRVEEFKRKIGTEQPTSALDRNMVIWDEGEHKPVERKKAPAHQQQHQHQLFGDDDDDGIDEVARS